MPLDWTEDLKNECKKNNIDYFTSPYSLDFIDKLNQYVSAWKVGSGDITFHESIEKMAKTNKTVIIATGASEISEVVEEKFYLRPSIHILVRDKSPSLI